MEFFNTYFLDILKTKYADFNGRARRKEYWMFVLVYFIIMAVLGGIFGAIDSILGRPILTLLLYLVPLAILVPAIALVVRRLHDVDKPWVWIFVSFIPIIGGIWMLVLMCTPGTVGDNQFGPDPKAGEIA